MSDVQPPPAGPAVATTTTDPVASERPRRRRWQVGLRTLFLLIAAIAVWTGDFVNRRQIAALKVRIAALRPLARELLVDDPGQAAVVKRQEHWYDENGWDLYLPGGSYRLCVATHDVSEVGLASVVKSAPLRSGRHRIALEKTKEKGGWRVAVSWDETGRMVVEESPEWVPGSSSIGGGEFTQCEQLAADRPIVLYRTRFLPPNHNRVITNQMSPLNGLLLWVEPAAQPPAKP